MQLLTVSSPSERVRTPLLQELAELGEMESGDAEECDLIRGEEEVLRRELLTIEVNNVAQMPLGPPLPGPPSRSLSLSLLLVSSIFSTHQAQLVKALIPRDEADRHSAILEVRAGQCDKGWGCVWFKLAVCNYPLWL